MFIYYKYITRLGGILHMYDVYKHIWYNPCIEFLFDSNIKEYDIRDAGFSIIQQYHLLPDNEIQRLSRIEKGEKRHKAVGWLERDNKELAKNLSMHFGKVRELFINYNKIDPDNSIVSVKKDAIFMIGDVKRTKFGLIDFRVKNEYSSYLRFSNINNLELFYNEEKIDIKGMGDSAVARHRLYMYDFLQNIFMRFERHDVSIKRYIMNFIMKYKNNELEENYYVEFNSLSKDINPLFNYQKILIPLVELINKEIS